MVRQVTRTQPIGRCLRTLKAWAKDEIELQVPAERAQGRRLNICGTVVYHRRAGSGASLPAECARTVELRTSA